MSLSTKILIGLTLGIGCGLFFGEMMAVLDIVGKGFIQLLQMAVLPYVTVSLITGLGRLDLKEAKLLAVKGSILLFVTWVIAYYILLLMPMAFPQRESASFFSTALVESPKEIDLLNLYIPANPFYSLANNLVPAVVLFSIALGVALIGVKDKTGFIDALVPVQTALTTVTGFVVKLTPYGVFAIAASAAGTMTLDEFERLQVYFVAYIAGCLLATFWILPGLISALTPLRYKDVVGLSKDALVTAFTTGNLFVILPILSGNCKQLLEKYQLRREDSDALVDIIIPVSFNFPNVGKLMMLVFVLFAAWFAGVNVSLSQYPAFIVSSLVTFFGSVNVAVPFLLDSLRVPADLFQLFLVSTVVNMRFSTLVAAMHVLFLALLGTCAITGHLSFSLPRILRFVAGTAIITIATIVLSQTYFTYLVSAEYEEDKVVKGMSLQFDLTPTTVSSVVHRSLPDSYDLPEPGRSRLDVIQERGVLRVGYRPDVLPFSYFNANDELVGFDIEMANELAEEVGVRVEFVPVTRDTAAERLNKGYVDIIMSGIAGTTDLYAQEIEVPRPYMETNLALVVKDYRRDEFSTVESIEAMKSLTIAIPGGAARYFQKKLQLELPQAEILPIDSAKEFFEAIGEVADAMLYTAEAGAAWTLLYPHYSVVVPQSVMVKMPTVYMVPFEDVRMANFISNWIDLKKGDATIESLYDYWILGRGAVPRKPRWSVIRDVLHWVD